MPHFLTSFALHSTPSSNQARDDQLRDEVTKAFVDSMFRDRDCQGEPGDIEVRFDKNTGRRGVYIASEEGIMEGDYVFAIPITSAWVVENIQGNLQTNELSDAEKGLLFWKWKQESDDAWKSYKDILPTKKEAFDPTPDFWSDEQIRALELPPIVEGSLAKKKSVQALANEKYSRTLGLSEDDLRFSTWLVGSRAITILQMSDSEEEDAESEEIEDDKDFENLATTCVMVPLLDMINHSSDNPNAYFAVLGDDGGGSHTETDEESLFYAVIADRDLSKGEELLISYGSEEDSSIDLLIQYGFVPETNPHDVSFWETFDEENRGNELSIWTTTLQEDEDRLLELGDGREVAIDRTILEFRIRMKRAYAEWKNTSD